MAKITRDISHDRIMCGVACIVASSLLGQARKARVNRFLDTCALTRPNVFEQNLQHIVDRGVDDAADGGWYGRWRGNRHHSK